MYPKVATILCVNSHLDRLVQYNYGRMGKSEIEFKNNLSQIPGAMCLKFSGVKSGITYCETNFNFIRQEFVK